MAKLHHEYTNDTGAKTKQKTEVPVPLLLVEAIAGGIKEHEKCTEFERFYTILFWSLSFNVFGPGPEDDKSVVNPG